MVEYDSHSGEIKQSSVPTNASDDLERELTKDNLKIEQTSSKGGTLKDKIACLGTLGQGCHKIEGEYKEIYSDEKKYWRGR